MNATGGASTGPDGRPREHDDAVRNEPPPRLVDNAVFVREMTRGLSSRTLLVPLLLGPLSATTAAGVVWSGQNGVLGDDAVYAAILYALAPLLVLWVGGEAYFEARADGRDDRADALAATSLSPKAILRGHVASAALKVALTLAVSAPVAGALYLLRGVSLLELSALLFATFVAATIAAYVLAHAGCFSGDDTRSKIVAVLAAVFAVAWAAFGVPLVFGALRLVFMVSPHGLGGGGLCCFFFGVGLTTFMVWFPFVVAARARLARPSGPRIVAYLDAKNRREST
jgi:hypothetical protein